MAKQVRRAQTAWHGRIYWLLLAGLALAGLVFVTAPTFGLCLPLRQGGDWERAWQEIRRTQWDTMLYALGAGLVAVTLGFLAGWLAGKNERLRVVCLGMALAVFSLPPAQASLGIIQLASDTPAWADVFLRSRLTVCLALGIRFFPIAVVLGMRAWNTISPSWSEAAQMHAVPTLLFFRKVLAPFLAPYAAIAGLLVALLATAEIGTILLLHPPGHASFPLAIFTVMANAPERLVATLCFRYVALAALLLSSLFALLGRGDR
jgi:ABC-type Fe3+ transport system permease subunit